MRSLRGSRRAGTWVRRHDGPRGARSWGLLLACPTRRPSGGRVPVPWAAAVLRRRDRAAAGRPYGGHGRGWPYAPGAGDGGGAARGGERADGEGGTGGGGRGEGDGRGEAARVEQGEPEDGEEQGDAGPSAEQGGAEHGADHRLLLPCSRCCVPVHGVACRFWRRVPVLASRPRAVVAVLVRLYPNGPGGVGEGPSLRRPATHLHQLPPHHQAVAGGVRGGAGGEGEVVAGVVVAAAGDGEGAGDRPDHAGVAG